MTLAMVANAIFFALFLCYVAQLAWVVHRFRAAEITSLSQPSGELWIYFALSVLIPVIIGFFPDILVEIVKALLDRRSMDYPPALFLPTTMLAMGMKFVIAYLVTIITLELSLQAQSLNSNKPYSWRGLLLVNLGFDIASILVLQILRPVVEDSSDLVVILFFAVSSLTMFVTGTIVVIASYFELTK